MVPGAAYCRSCGAPVAGAETAQRRGSWRTPLLIALAIVLLGAGAAAAIVFGTDESAEPATVAVETETTDAAGEETEESEETVEEDIAAEEPEPYPPVSRGEMEEEIESLLLAFHEDVVARDYRSAWVLLTPRKRQQYLDEYGYEKWRKGQESLSDGLSPYGLNVRIDGLEGDGVARVMLTGMGWSDSDPSCTEWTGLTWVRYEGGEWAYDPGYSTTQARRRDWEPRSEALLNKDC